MTAINNFTGERETNLIYHISKVNLATHLHNVVDAGQKLSVDREAAIQRIAGLGHKALCEFALEH